MNIVIEEIIAYRNWRARELELLKKLKVNTFYSLDRRTNEQYFKMCIPYIYAHWEGFIVESFRLIIDYINKKELEEKVIVNELFAFSHKVIFKKLSGKQSFEQCCEFSEQFMHHMDKPIYIDVNLLTTNSNLKYEQLVEIFTWFKLDITACKEYKQDINKLVNLRNRIAHGENGVNIEFEAIESFVMKIQELYDIVIILLDKYIENCEYMKETTPETE